MKKYIYLKEPQTHDFPAAKDYLELLYDEKKCIEVVRKLKDAKTISKKAKDIFRASSLPLLSKKNIFVNENLQKIKKGIKLSPILLTRGDSKLIIADGYHRMCASYYYNENLEIPCRLV
jgi:hypothetical protein